MIQMTPQYNTILFRDVWEYGEDFILDFKASVFNKMNSFTDDSLELVFGLLFAKYANNPIANEDVEQFKAKMFSVLFSYGPTWLKRLEIQDKLRNLSEEDIIKGGKAIYNNALNPDGSPATQSLEELPRINSQSTTNYKKSRLEAYAMLEELLNTDITTQFIKKFQVCFKQFVRPEETLLYYEGDLD